MKRYFHALRNWWWRHFTRAGRGANKAWKGQTLLIDCGDGEERRVVKRVDDPHTLTLRKR